VKRFAAAPPNPPELFEGRASELATLVGRLRANPLTIVWGAPGLGKTGLVLSALSKARVSEAIVLSAADFGGGAAFLAELGRQIAGETGVTFEDAVRPGESVALMLGIAAAMERVTVPIVLEDLHELEESLVDVLLLALARRARRARVVVTTRRRPRHDDLVERVLTLEPLDNATIESIALKVRPSLEGERVRAVVESAAGSPRLARQHALGIDVRRSIAMGLRVETRQLAHALAELDVPVRAPTDAETEALAAELFDYGFVEWGPLGVRVVPNLRALLRAPAEEVSSARRTALAIALADPRPAAVFDAVRLAAALGDETRVCSLLEAHIESLMAHGYAEALFDVLVPELGEGAAAFFSHALHVAHALLSGRSLGWARAQAEPRAPHDRLRWCQILAHGGDVATSERSVLALVEDPSASEVRDTALLLYGDILSWSGAPTRALAVLERVEPADPTLRASRDLRISTALSRLGRSEEAGVRLSAALEASQRLPEPGRLRLRVALVGALLAATRFADLERLLGVTEPAIGAPAPTVFATLAMATERGHAELARRILEHAHLLEDESLSLRFAVRYNSLRLRAAFGPHDELDSDARAYLADERMAVVPDFVVYLYGAHVNTALLMNTVPVRAPERGLEGDNVTLVAAWRALALLRRGEPCEVPTRGSTMPEVELVVLRAHAELALFENAPEEAASRSDAGLTIARGQGLRLEELLLLALKLDAQLLAAAVTRDAASKQAAAATALELERLATVLGSSRFRAEAALAHWALSEAGSPAELARLCDGVSDASSPVAKRRAAALMGRPSALDALDQKVVAAIVAGQARADALVLDVLGKRVALPSGAVVDLASAPLHLKILEVLFRAGGAASKAELAVAAWGVTKYHPARDDKRMQVAMHRLRHVLELDPAKPRWLVRTDDGYRVAAPMVLGSVG
jgi:hypothetical protein